MVVAGSSIAVTMFILLLAVSLTWKQKHSRAGFSDLDTLSEVSIGCAETDIFQPSASDYFSVKGVGKKVVPPLDWLGAAYNGNQWAQCRVGDYYASGSNGFRKSLSEAFRWWNMSAEQGNIIAKSRLVEYYIFNFYNIW